MDFILLACGILLLVGARPFFKKFNDDYISRDQTLCINGFFVLIVFLRHFQQYMSFGECDMIYQGFTMWMSQLLVVPFLFYSGYGIYLSITSKGQAYVGSVMTKRFPKVLLHFALAVLIFLITDIILGREFPPGRIILSFIGWESIGNSNWYIFDTLVLYILTFLSFTLCKNDRRAALVAMFALTSGYIAFMSQFKAPYWYNTCILFPVGMIFAELKDKLTFVMKKYWFIFLVSLIASVILVMYLSVLRIFFLGYEFLAVMFMLAIVLLTMKLKIGNPILRFLGKHIFEIYILQRLPMLILYRAGLDKYVYFGICLASTLLLAVGFRLLTGLLDKLIDGKPAKKKLKSAQTCEAAKAEETETEEKEETEETTEQTAEATVSAAAK